MEHTKRFTELGREEKGEGADRGDLVEKTESPKGKRAVKPVISFPSEKWVLRIGFFKGTKLVSRSRSRLGAGDYMQVGGSVSASWKVFSSKEKEAGQDRRC